MQPVATAEFSYRAVVAVFYKSHEDIDSFPMRDRVFLQYLVNCAAAWIAAKASALKAAGAWQLAIG
ncbi:MAG: hypothetical protein ACOH2H_00075 [Cypionkella sp.]